MPHHRTLVWVSACIALVALVPISLAAAGGATTRVVSVRPVSTAGALLPGYRVAKRYAGAQCSANGSENMRGAYRCFSGNGVFDPCWPSRSDGASVICMADPWSHQVFQLDGAKGLVTEPAARAQPYPWGLALVGGARCNLVDGATSLVDGKRASYACSDKRVLLADPTRRSGGLWSIESSRSVAGSYEKPIAARIATAWFGSSIASS